MIYHKICEYCGKEFETDRLSQKFCCHKCSEEFSKGKARPDMYIHQWAGNILLYALHTGMISKEFFLNLCNDEQREFYEQIIDLDITSQVVVKQGELLESQEVDN